MDTNLRIQNQKFELGSDHIVWSLAHCPLQLEDSGSRNPTKITEKETVEIQPISFIRLDLGFNISWISLIQRPNKGSVSVDTAQPSGTHIQTLDLPRPSLL